MIPQSQINEALDYMDLTDPNMNSGNFKPIERRFSSGVAMERHMQLVEAGLKKLGMHKTHASDVETLSAKGSALLSTVRNIAQQIVAAHEVDGKHIDRAHLTASLMGFYMDGLTKFTKDEQHILMASWLALKTAEEFR